LIPDRVRHFSLRHRVQTDSGTLPTSYPMCTNVLSPEVRRPGHETDHSPPCSAEVKNVWSYTYTPSYVFMARWLIQYRTRLQGVVLS
jgi:hypothetical protein